MKLQKIKSDPLFYVREGNIATLLQDMKIILYTDEGTYKLTIKKGFKWNGNSGAFPCRFSKDNEKYNVIILVHDALYHRIGLSKADADEILCGGLKLAGYNKFMCELIHWAVKTFARCAYNEDDKMTLDNLDFLEFEDI